MQMRNSISDRSRKRNIKTKSLIKITCVILMLLFLCLIVGRGLWEQAPGRVYYGVTKEWRYWVDCMLSTAQERDYVYTFAWVDDEKADFTWRFCDDRESIVEAFTEEKENMRQIDKDAVLWYFMKLRLDDDIHGTDIYEYLEQKWLEDKYGLLAGTEDKYEIFAETVDGGSGYCIGQGYRKEEENGFYYRYLIRNVVIDNGYLYLLACDTITEESIKTVAEQIGHFQSFFRFNKEYHGGEHFIDMENLYWIDHTQRVIESENSECTILEERAKNSGWCYADDCLTKYFGMLKEAEYRVKLSPEMPEMTVSFQFMGDVEGDCYETYLSYSDCKHEEYRMEVRMADGRLLQEEAVWLSICNQDREVWKDWKWETDMIRFEDLDGDGYPDMKITHPNHVVKHDGTKGQHEDYWLWNQETETLEEMDTLSQAVLLARQEENSVPSAKEETEAEPQVIPHTLTFVVEDGDSLWKLAEKYYGDGKRWREVYEYNQEAIGENPSLILPGTELEIP